MLRLYIAIFLCLFLFHILTGLLLLSEFYTENLFLLYRLANNLSNGHGIVLNPGDTTLFTLTPIPAIFYALAPTEAQSINIIATAVAYAITGTAIIYILHSHQIKRTLSVTIVAVWLVSWPVWSGFQLPPALSLSMSLSAMIFISNGHLRMAGFIGGCLVLVEPGGIIAALLIGLYAQSRFYWHFAWIPGALWGMLAVIQYQDIELTSTLAQAHWANGIWIMIFLVSTIILTRQHKPVPPILWIISTWSGITVIVDIAFNHTLFTTNHPVIGLAVAANIVFVLDRIKYRYLVWAVYMVGSVSVLLIAPPQTHPILQQDIALARTLNVPAHHSLLHDRSHALDYFIDGFVYTVENNPVQQIARLSPDYVLASSVHTEQLQAPGISALNYTLSGSVWKIGNITRPLSEHYQTDIAYRPDAILTDYAISSSRTAPGQTINLQLGWQITHDPQSNVGLNISIISMAGEVITSISDTLEPGDWNQPRTHTYHVLMMPQDTAPGLHQLNVTVQYNAGIIGSHMIGELVVPFPKSTIDEENILANITPIQLHQANLNLRPNKQLHIDLAWSTTQLLEQNYNVFVHFSTDNDATPLRQADGPPVNGRYPTQYWQVDEIIEETRTLNLEDVPTGDYHIYIGFYDNTGTRLANTSLQIATISINTDGKITISPQY